MFPVSTTRRPDPIKQPLNLLTDLNALMGIAYVHPYAQNTDLSTVAPEDITTTTNSQQGTTTIYRVPTEQLPLTMPLRQLGAPNAVVDQIDATLRPIIDQGYADPQPRQARTRPSHPVSAVRGAQPSPQLAAAPVHSLRAAVAGGVAKATNRSDGTAHRQRTPRS